MLKRSSKKFVKKFVKNFVKKNCQKVRRKKFVKNNLKDTKYRQDHQWCGSMRHYLWQFWRSRHYWLVTTIFTKLLVHAVRSGGRQCAIWGIFARPAITQQSLENGEDRIWGQEQKVKGGTISSLSYKRVCLVKFNVNLIFSLFLQFWKKKKIFQRNNSRIFFIRF